MAERFGESYLKEQKAKPLIHEAIRLRAAEQPVPPHLSLRAIAATVGTSRSQISRMVVEAKADMEAEPYEPASESRWRPKLNAYARLQAELEQKDRWIELYREENRELRERLGLEVV